MKALFSDRLWLPKLGLAAALFAWMGHRAQVEIRDLHPNISRVAVFGDALRDKRVSVAAREVVGHAPDGFDLDTDVGSMRILTAERPPQGAIVTVMGRVAGNRRIEATRVQINEGWKWKRALNYGVSVATVLVFLWLIRKRFRLRLSEGLFRSRC